MIIATFRDTAFAGGSTHNVPDDDSETEPEDDDIVEVAPRPSKAAGWAYIGSHNFTPSAWGTLSGTSFNPVLNVRISVARPAKFVHISFTSDHEFRTRHRGPIED